MIKLKEITLEKKQEVLDYAKANGIYPTYNKYRAEGIKIYPDTIKYWLDPELREKKKNKGKIRYNTKLKNDPAYIQRCDEYRTIRKESGTSHEKWKIWYAKNRDKRSKMLKQKRIDNLPAIKIILKEKHKAFMESTTAEQRRELRSRYYTVNKKLAYYEQYRERYKTDPLFKLKIMMRNNVSRALEHNDMSKQCPSHQYLGCTIEEFRLHIEKQFKEGMTWENHGRGEMAWHLDHITPLATLKDINDQEKLKQICHYTNYQPLWEFDNLSKGNKYDI